MVRVAVVVHSPGGTNRLMAEGVLEGAASVDGVEATLHAVEGADITEGRFARPELLEALDACDAIVFGCPTYMGSVSAQMKALLDATLQRFYTRAWVDKVASGFTVSAAPSGDKLNALLSIAMCAMQLGMIWVGQGRTSLNAEGVNRLAVYFGAAGVAEYGGEQPTLPPQDRETGVLHGARVARIAKALRAGAPAE